MESCGNCTLGDKTQCGNCVPALVEGKRPAPHRFRHVSAKVNPGAPCTVESARASASKHTYTKCGNACSVGAMPLGGWEGPRLQESGRRKTGQIREDIAVGNNRLLHFVSVDIRLSYFSCIFGYNHTASRCCRVGNLGNSPLPHTKEKPGCSNHGRRTQHA